MFFRRIVIPLVSAGIAFYTLRPLVENLIWGSWIFGNMQCVAEYEKTGNGELALKQFKEREKQCGQFFGIYDGQDLMQKLDKAAQLAIAKNDLESAAKFNKLSWDVSYIQDDELTDFQVITYMRTFVRTGRIALAKELIEKERDVKVDIPLGKALKAWVDSEADPEAAAKQLPLAYLAQEMEFKAADQTDTELRQNRARLMRISEIGSEIFERSKEIEKAQEWLIRATELAKTNEDWKNAVLLQRKLVSFYKRNALPSKTEAAKREISVLEQKKHQSETDGPADWYGF